MAKKKRGISKQILITSIIAITLFFLAFYSFPQTIRPSCDYISTSIISENSSGVLLRLDTTGCSFNTNSLNPSVTVTTTPNRASEYPFLQDHEGRFLLVQSPQQSIEATLSAVYERRVFRNNVCFGDYERFIPQTKQATATCTANSAGRPVQPGLQGREQYSNVELTCVISNVTFGSSDYPCEQRLQEVRDSSIQVFIPKINAPVITSPPQNQTTGGNQTQQGTNPPAGSQDTQGSSPSLLPIIGGILLLITIGWVIVGGILLLIRRKR